MLTSSLPGVLLIASVAAASVEQATEQTRDEAGSAARFIAANRSATYGRATHLLGSVARRPRTADLTPDACSEVPEPAAADPAYAYMALYAPNGRVVCGSPLDAASWPGDVATAAWFRSAMAGERGVASAPFKGVGGRWLQVVAEPARGDGRDVSGVLVLASDLGEVRAAISDVSLPRGSVIRILAEGGAVLASNDDPGRWIGTDLGSNPIVAQLLQDPSSTPTGDGLGADGAEQIFAAAPVEGSGGIALVGIPTSVRFELIQVAVVRAGAILVGVILIGIALSVYVANRISGPIRRLASMADADAAGKRVEAAPISGPSEVARVADSFNAMVSAREDAEVEARIVHRRLALLHVLDRAILAARSPSDIARLALDRIGPWTGALWASVVALSPEGPIELAVLGSAPSVSEEGSEIPFRTPASAIDAILATGSLELPDLLMDPDGTPYAEAFGARSAYGFRLDADGEPVGVLAIFRAAPGQLTDGERDTLREVANELAMAIQSAALREQVASHAAELEGRVRARTVELQELNVELDAFSETVSHDLRAPLRQMRGFAAALLEDEAHQLGPRGRDYAQRIVSSGARMEALVEDLLEYSHLSRARLGLRRVSLREVAEEAIAAMSGEAGPAGTIRIEGELPSVLGHEKTLVRIVSNLLSNALKFVPHGIVPDVVVSAQHRDSMVRLSITDNGIGIAPESRDWIFRIFERLHGMETYPGTGIGLAIVRKGMERMGGRSGVESAIGGGSRFWIELAPAVAAHRVARVEGT